MLSKNFFRGAATVLQLFPAHSSDGYEEEKLYTPPASDLESLQGDWKKIGQDLWRAMGYEAKKLQKQTD